MAKRNLPEPEISYFKLTLVRGNTSRNVLLDVESAITCEDPECARELLETCIGSEELADLGELRSLEIVALPHGKAFVYGFSRDRVLLVLHRKDVDVWTTIRNVIGLQ